MNFIQEHKKGSGYGALGGLVIFGLYWLWKKPTMYAAINILDLGNAAIDKIGTIQPGYKLLIIFVLVGAFIGLIASMSKRWF